MQLEQIIRNGLLSDTGVAALLGTNLFLIQLPQDSFSPSINPPGTGHSARAVYQRISTNRLYAHASTNDSGWSRFSFSIWDYTPGSVLAIATAITNALQKFTAQSSDSPPTPNAPNFVIDQRMEVEPETNPPLYKSILDVRFFFQDQ